MKIEALISLASFTFWISFFSIAIVRIVTEDNLYYTILCDAAAIGLISSIWVLSAHLLQFSKLDDYNIYSAFLIGVLITASAMIYLKLTQFQTLGITLLACTLTTGLPYITRKINKYIG